MSGERDPLASIGAAIEALKNDDALKVFLVGNESIIAEHFPESVGFKGTSGRKDGGDRLHLGRLASRSLSILLRTNPRKKLVRIWLG